MFFEKGKTLILGPNACMRRDIINRNRIDEHIIKRTVESARYDGRRKEKEKRERYLHADTPEPLPTTDTEPVTRVLR